MQDFIDADMRPVLARHGLGEFSALWGLQLQEVDEPNTERGGWSSVARLELGGEAFYLKRQINHLTRSFRHPFGEPTFAREFRAIEKYRRLGIPALQAVYYAQRKLPGGQHAILITRALDGWQELQYWLKLWPELDAGKQDGIIRACAELAKNLHSQRQLHGCFYPKHIFLHADEPQQFRARLIDLEKSRLLVLGRHERIKDLETLARRTYPVWRTAQWRRFLQFYLEQTDEEQIERWLTALNTRQRHKENRI